MLPPDLCASLTDDDRGVSFVIGFVIVFAALVVLLSVNQAQVLPQKNEAIEFQHFEDVQADMLDVRDSVLRAGSSEVSQFPTVRLGTDYPPRLFGVNPAPTTGTLQTSEPYNVTITNQTGATANVSSRFLEYRPFYNELEAGSTWYENSVFYLDDRDRGGVSVREDHELVDGGRALVITALQNEFRARGRQQVSVELYPDRATTPDDIPSGNLTVTVPTRLTAEEYWAEGFASDPGGFYRGVDNNSYDSGVHGLEFNVDTGENDTELRLNVVGLG